MAKKQLSRKLSFLVTDQKLPASRQWLGVVRMINIPPSRQTGGLSALLSMGNLGPVFINEFLRELWVYREEFNVLF